MGDTDLLLVLRGSSGINPRQAEPLTFAPMAAEIITAEELEKMTPAQRQAAFDASIVTNLDDAPPELLARTRKRVRRIIRESDSPSTT